MKENSAEQRRFPRFHYSIPIKYKQPDKPGPTYTVTRDISVGGMRLLTNSFIPRHTKLGLEVEVPPKNVVNAEATVVWSNRINHSDQYLSGVKFSDLNENDKRNISDLVSYALSK